VSKTTRKKPRATRKPKPQAPEAPPLPEIQGPEVFGLDATLHEAIPEQLPILPVRGVVMFPGTVMPLGVGRAASRRMLEENLPASKVIGIVTQRDEDDEAPGPADVYPVGTAALVLKLVRQPDDTLSLIVHGLGRIRLTDFVQTQPYMRANVEPMHEEFEQGKVSEAAVKNLRETAIELIDMTPNAPEQAQTVVMNIDGAGATGRLPRGKPEPGSAGEAGPAGRGGCGQAHPCGAVGDQPATRDRPPAAEDQR
jgi:Lon protease-like protein